MISGGFVHAFSTGLSFAPGVLSCFFDRLSWEPDVETPAAAACAYLSPVVAGAITSGVDLVELGVLRGLVPFDFATWIAVLVKDPAKRMNGFLHLRSSKEGVSGSSIAYVRPTSFVSGKSVYIYVLLDLGLKIFCGVALNEETC